MKRKAGFTLIELVVAIVMACILLASLTPLLTLAQNGTYTAQRSTRAAQAGDAISEYIMNLLKNAERVYIGDDGDHKPDDWAQWNSISVSKSGKDGLLAVNGATVYPLEYQEGCALTLSALGDNRDHLTLGVALGDNRSSDTLYSKQSSVRLAGLEQNGFGQLEGLTGAQVWCDGFPGEPQTIGTASNVRSLVIYFKGDGSLLPEFTPGAGGAPADPTPGPSAFSVTLPARMEVEVGEQTSLRGYVTWPQGVDAASKGKAFWELSAGGNTYLDMMEEATGVFPTAYLRGLFATAPDQPVRVTLTVTCTVNGVPQTASATCDITVWQESISGDLKLFRGNGGNWDSKQDIAHQILFLKASDYKWNTLTISAVLKGLDVGGGRLLDGTWTSSNKAVLADYTPSNKDNSYYSGSALGTGMTRLTFTASGHISGSGELPEIKGSQTYVDVIFYDENDVKATLLFESTSSNTASVPFTQIGSIAEYAVFSLEIGASVKGDMRQAMLQYLASTSVQLAVNGYNPPWPDHPLIQEPSPVPLSLPLSTGQFQCRVPLVFNRDINSSSERFPDGSNGIGAKLVDSAGNTLFDLKDLIPQGKRLSLTVTKATSISDILDHEAKPLPETITVSEVQPFGGYNIGINGTFQGELNHDSIQWFIRKQGSGSWIKLDQSAGNEDPPASFDTNLCYYFSGAPYNIVLSKSSTTASGSYELYLQFTRNGTEGRSTILNVALQ